MSNEEHWHVDFGHTGPHTTFHHQCLQIVDLMIMHCERSMDGLNPHALPYEPEASNNKTKEEKKSPSKDKSGTKKIVLTS